MSDLTLPPHIHTILITGAGGYVGQKLVQLLLSTQPKVQLITTDIRAPPFYSKLVKEGDERLVSVACDLGKKEEVEKLFEGRRIQGVFALHGIMSGGSEADFTLGYSVNLYSHLHLLETMRTHSLSRPKDEPLPVYVNTSSLAVYGGEKATPESKVFPEETPLVPESSYGVAKSVVELLVYDFSRKGYINGRSVRLPTVTVRTGAPSSAASSFISGLIREPLMGQPSICPIANSSSDAVIDGMPIYITSSKTVVENIVRAMGLDEKVLLDVGGKGVGRLRTVNLPGFRITTRDILNALEKTGGKKALDLVSYSLDPKVLAICETWAGDYDSDKFVKMGFKRDEGGAVGFEGAVRDFVEEMGLKF